MNQYILLYGYVYHSYFALQFMEKYLNDYKIPLGIKICDGTWNVFIKEVIDKYDNILCTLFTLSCQLIYMQTFRRSQPSLSS